MYCVTNSRPQDLASMSQRTTVDFQRRNVAVFSRYSIATDGEESILVEKTHPSPYYNSSTTCSSLRVVIVICNSSSSKTWLALKTKVISEPQSRNVAVFKRTNRLQEIRTEATLSGTNGRRRTSTAPGSPTNHFSDNIPR